MPTPIPSANRVRVGTPIKPAGLLRFRRTRGARRFLALLSRGAFLLDDALVFIKRHGKRALDLESIRKAGL